MKGLKIFNVRLWATVNAITILMFLNTGILSAQENEALYSVGLHLNYYNSLNEYEYFEQTSSVEIRDRIQLTQKTNIIPAFSLRMSKTSGWYQEYTLAGVGYKKEIETEAPFMNNAPITQPPVRGTEKESANLRLRWEVGKMITISKKFNYGIGVGMEPNFSFVKFRPLDAGSRFPADIYSAGNDLFVNGSIEYKIGDKLAIVGRVPIRFMRFSWQSYNIDDPGLPDSQQSSTLTNIDVDISNIEFGIGVRYHFEG